MSSVWDRQERRIGYQVPVGVLDLTAKRVLDMTCINVSRGGMFVDTNEPLAVGTPLMCNFPHSRDREAMQLRGRVAWLRLSTSVEESRPHGVGIEFVDLQSEEREHLSDIVGGNEEHSHALGLLEGMSGPIRGRAQLPLLALESDAKFALPGDDEEAYQGCVTGLEVCKEPGLPMPRLRAGVAVEDTLDFVDVPSEGGAQRDEYEVVLADADVPKCGLRLDEGDDTEKTTMDCAIAVPQMLPIVLPDVAKLNEKSNAVAGDDIDIDIDIDIDESANQDESVVFDGTSLDTQRIGRATSPLVGWLGGGMLVAGLVAILGFAVLGGEQQKKATAPGHASQSAEHERIRAIIEPNREANARSPEGSPKEAVLAANEATPPTSMPRKESAALVKEHTAVSAFSAPTTAFVQSQPTPTSLEPAKVPVVTHSQERIGGVRISDRNNTLVIRLPLRGNLEQAVDYRLANPAGIAVNLPYAQPKAGFHASLDPEHGMVRTVWVRERLGGVHFRVYFALETPVCEVRYLSDAVVLRCKS